METKERKNKNTMTRRSNTGKGAERLDMKFGGKHMTPNSPLELGRRIFLYVTCTN